jgi:predicted Zn-dependent peptidase
MNTHTFPNGFRVIYEKPMNSLNVSSIIAFCNLGPVHEPSNLYGVSHFIEHMCFKGTKKIHLSKTLFETFDNVGTYYNASTNKRFTQYDIKCTDENINKSIYLLSDMLLNSTFDKKEYTKELAVVIEENLQDSEDNENILNDNIESMLYKSTVFEHPIDHIKYHTDNTMKYDEVMETYQLFYQPQNIILSVVSNTPFKKIIKAIESSYFSKKTLINKSIPCLNLTSILGSKEVQYKFIKGNEKNICYLKIAFNVCNQYNNDKYILNFIRSLLGGPFSSRLFMTLREYNGLTYSIDVDTQYFEIGGDFTITTVCDNNKLLKNKDQKGVFPLIIDVIRDLLTNGVSKKEFEIIKNYIHGKLTISQEDNDIVAQHNGEYMLLYNNSEIEYIKYSDAYKKYYHPISINDVNSIIKKYFTKENMKICVMGDVKKKDFQKIVENW